MFRHLLAVVSLLFFAGIAFASPVAEPVPQLDNALAGLPVLGTILAPVLGGTAAGAAPAADPPD